MKETICCGGNGDCPDQGRKCPLRYAPATKRANRCSISSVIGVAALFVLAMAMCGVLSGCKRVPDAPARPIQDGGWLKIYTDGSTGCEYLGQTSSSAGITPRIAADGHTHLGCGTTEPAAHN